MGARLQDDDELAESHEINVTPFIDVMLVLLIIFMVAAPLSTVAAPVDLPESNAPPPPTQEAPLELTLAADLTLSVESMVLLRDTLGPALDALTGGDKEERIHIRADQAVAYGEVMALMNDLRRAGYLKVALVGLQETRAP